MTQDELDRHAPRREALPQRGEPPPIKAGVEGSYIKLIKSLPGVKHCRKAEPPPFRAGSFTYSLLSTCRVCRIGTRHFRALDGRGLAFCQSTCIVSHLKKTPSVQQQKPRQLDISRRTRVLFCRVTCRLYSTSTKKKCSGWPSTESACP